MYYDFKKFSNQQSQRELVNELSKNNVDAGQGTKNEVFQ